jgi:hypothetical protein
VQSVRPRPARNAGLTAFIKVKRVSDKGASKNSSFSRAVRI